jgi:NAD+ synthase
MSGGVDSAAVAHLCAKAVGPDDVTMVWLGCESSSVDFEHSKLAADSVGGTLLYADLSKTCQSLLSALPFDKMVDKITRANAKSRLRMVALYALANARNLLVAGTGDKSEDEIGYFTKYGDGGVDFLPIASLLKSEVRTLASHMGVPQVIVDKPSSPGLWHGQTAEGELGLRYDDVDAVLMELPHADPQVTERVNKLREKSAHKRAYPPIFPWPPVSIGAA